MSGSEQNGLPLRNAGVPCEHCGCEKRRPNINRCAACGRFAPDPIYAYSHMTDMWYRVWDWDRVNGDKIRANSKERVARKDVPENWRRGVLDRSVNTATRHTEDAEGGKP